ncbi:MAG: aminotransferase class V-fold PLP-dependent enzyme [Planctomycetota bacterium]
MNDTVYLNQAGTSWPKPAPVLAAAAEALTADPAQWADRFVAAQRNVASLFHISEPGDLLLTPGCTAALSIAVADHRWQTGDRVLTSGLEHHALHRPLVKLAEQGVSLEVIPRGENEPLALEALEESLRDGGVRMVALTAASNVTGELLPLDDVIHLAHRYGAMALVDAAQLVGWQELDLPALGADLTAFGGHKGLHGLWGVGGLYIAPHVEMNSPAATCGAPENSSKPRCASRPGYCDAGSVDRAALAALAAAADWLRTEAPSDRLGRARELAEQLEQGATALPRLTTIVQTPLASRLPIFAFTVAGRSAGQVAAEMAADGVHASGGLQCAPLAHETLQTNPDGAIRLSVGVMNDAEDIERALGVLRRVLGSPDVS